MIDQKKYNRLISILVIVILLLFPAYLIQQYYISNAEKNISPTAKYVGKDACIECHEAEYNDWRGSDHDLAMDLANDTTVLADFNNVTIIRNNQNHKCYKKGNQFFVYTDGENGEMKEYEVKYVFGHFPLQNYLVEFPGGRLQTLALTWNSINSEWFYMADSVYKEMSVTHTNWLHWTNQAQNWNSMCADCHSTDLKKGYDLATDTYHTTWSEIDVSCEACHGPSSEHLKWANLAEYARKDFINYGLPIKTSGIDNIQYVDNCARCHSRRATLDDFDGHPQSIYNHIIPSIPNKPNWHIDGQIKEEDYVYASFTQSRMFMNDIKCNDCHNVHSGKLVLEGNALCLQCHKADDYDRESHTFHKGYGENGESVISDAGVRFEVGSGTECINCHMHGQNFMGIDYRRDHSFRIPRPDLSEKNGTPNACNQCHTDESNKWSQSHIEDWFGKSRPFQFGEAFTAANNQNSHADEQLHRIINDDLYPTSIRSIALSYLSSREENDQLIKQSLLQMDPSLRISAINAIYLNSEDDLEKLLPLLYDVTKAVRMEVALRLSYLDTTLIPNNYKDAFKDVLAERLATLKYNADFPIGKYNLANFYFQAKDFKNAEFYYLKTIEQDHELSIARINLANLYGTIGEPLKAEKVLEEYVLDFPNDGNGLYNYGLILSENRKYEKSLEHLIKASELMPLNGRIDYNIALLYDFFSEKANAEKYLKLAIDKRPNEISNYSNLLNFYIQNKDEEKARLLTAKIKMMFTD